MSKNQRILLLCLVVCIVVYGLFNNNHVTFECYIMRTEDGTTFVQDQNPVFTDGDISGFDDKKMLILFNADMINKMAEGKLFKAIYRDEGGRPIVSEDYVMHGISSLGAKYPDRIVMYVDGQLVFNGYFEPPIVMSYMPPGPYVRTFETYLELNKGFGTLESFTGGGTGNFKELKEYFMRY